MHRTLGRLHAELHRARRAGERALARPPGEAGQGTVEYVALILLVALVMAGVVAGLQRFQTDQGRELADVILDKIRDAVRRVAF